MKKAILILLLIILSACEKSAEIENSNGIFTEADINDLNWIIKEFDDILKTKYKTNNIEKAYLEYSNEVWQGLSEKQPPYIPVSDGMELLGKKAQDLGVFPKIWSFWQGKPEQVEVYNIKQKPYLNYLQERGKKSDFIKDYAQLLSSAWDINPSVVGGFARNIENIDLKNKNNRLIFAIHYLTLINR